MSHISPRLIVDPKTNSLKIEETLKDHIEILVTMNEKMNTHIHTYSELKDYLLERLTQVEKVSLNKDFNSGEIEAIPARYDMLQIN